MMKRIFTLILFYNLFFGNVFSQGTNSKFGNPAYHIVDRLEIKTGKTAPFHSSLKYYTRGDLTQYALMIDTARVPLSSRDRFDLYYIFKDNNEWLICPEFPTTIGGPREKAMMEVVDENTDSISLVPASQMDACYASDKYILTNKPLLKIFYKSPANAVEVNQKYFHFRANPILDFRVAQELGESKTLFFNRRGLEFRGGIDDRIYFYTNILETQAQFADYATERIQRDRAIPGAGFFKDYESNLFNIENGYDFLTSQGYIGFNATKHVGFQLGHGRNFIGNGYRSLLLSDFANNYFYLKANWKVWKFHYQNIFAELSAQSNQSVSGDIVTPKKYMAGHHLSFNVNDNLNVGFFEVTIFNRDSTGNQFELQYLNPFILYRTVEQGLGSKDNVLIGLDFKWNFLNRFQLYGQLMLDEFVFNDLIIERNGSLNNKNGFQLGLKYIDAFGIDHLDLQTEFNMVRPYTYTHRDSIGSSYTHDNQPLAHPLGANFRELLFIARYQPTKKLFLNLRFLRANFGEDEDHFETNWGGNLLLPHNRIEQEFNNEIAQGISATTNLVGVDISYQLWHNLFLELEYFYRKKDSDMDSRDNKTSYIGGGVRFNIGRYRLDF